MYLGFFLRGVTPTESRYGIEMILICRDYFGRDCKMTHSYYHHLFF
jgi:hypothetical protein